MIEQPNVLILVYVIVMKTRQVHLPVMLVKYHHLLNVLHEKFWLVMVCDDRNVVMFNVKILDLVRHVLLLRIEELIYLAYVLVLPDTSPVQILVKNVVNLVCVVAYNSILQYRLSVIVSRIVLQIKVLVKLMLLEQPHFLP